MDSWKLDNDNNVRIYSGLVQKYGCDVRALDWGSRESQQLRFSVLAQVGNLDGASVLDVGCGLGDFFEWTRNSGLVLDYTGIDLTPSMIELARQRFPRARFEVADLLSYAPTATDGLDFVVESGIFTFRKQDAFDYLRATVTRMFDLCSRAVAFNCLSAWAPGQDAGEFYADPLKTTEFCRSLTPWVVLRHDYHARDFTVYMYRDRAA